MKTKNGSIGTLERGLILMEHLAQGAPEKSISELSRETSFNQSTTYRILSVLRSQGFVRQNKTNSKYMLTLKLFELGSKVDRHLNLREEALPILEELATNSEESSYLIIRDRDEAFCLERIDRNPHIRLLALEVGGRMPLHLGAGPKAILANLPEEEVAKIIQHKGLVAWTANSSTNPILLKEELQQIREQGYAHSHNDATEGVAAIGSPVKNERGGTIAAVSVAGLASNFNEENLPRLIQMVKSAASALSRKLRTDSF